VTDSTLLSSANEVASDDETEVVEDAAAAAVDVEAAVDVAAAIVADTVVETDAETELETDVVAAGGTAVRLDADGLASDDSGASFAGEAFLFER